MVAKGRKRHLRNVTYWISTLFINQNNSFSFQTSFKIQITKFISKNLPQKLHLNASEIPAAECRFRFDISYPKWMWDTQAHQTKYQINSWNFNVSVEIPLGGVPILSHISNINLRNQKFKFPASNSKGVASLFYIIFIYPIFYTNSFVSILTLKSISVFIKFYFCFSSWRVKKKSFLVIWDLGFWFGKMNFWENFEK